MKKYFALSIAVIIFALLFAGCAQEIDIPAEQPPIAETPQETVGDAAPTPPQQPEEPDTPQIQQEETAPTERIVIDQLGREVIVPESVSSVAVSHGPMLNMVVALGGGDLIVGTGPKPSGRTIFDVVAPGVMDTPQIGQQVNVNLEELATIDPDIFVLSVRNRELLPDLDMLEIPGVAIDPENFETVITSMRIVGYAIGNEDHVENVISLFEQRLAWTSERVAQATANPTALVFGADTSSVAANNMIQADILEIAGAVNLAADIEGGFYVDVGIEQILLWNPEYILITAWGRLQPEDFFNEPRLEDVTAVRNGNVFMFPSDAEWWDMPTPLAVLGAVWASHILHPDLVTSDDLDYAVEEFYYLLHGVQLGREFFLYQENVTETPDWR